MINAAVTRRSKLSIQTEEYQAMRAADVMTRRVIAVGPSDLLQNVAKLLLMHKISGAPVVDRLGGLIGIITEGDFLRRIETETEHLRPWWLEVLTGRERLASDYVNAHARKVEDVMTTDVVTASPHASLRDVVKLMERNKIKRVPVVEDEKIVGIISRANLLQAFATLSLSQGEPPPADDKRIREGIMERIRNESWSSPSSLNITVHAGVAEIWGAVESEVERKAIRIAVETTPGVRGITDHLSVNPITSGL